MIVADPPDVYGYTIFCDDIRVEVGGKLTYVGAYQDTMVVHGTFPVVLPKFAMHFVYRQRRPNVIPPTKIVIVTPGHTEENPAMTIEMGEEAAIEATAKAEATKIDGEDPRFLVMQGPLTLTNLVIQEPGQIKVRAVRGDQFIRLGTLRIVQDPKFASSETKEAAN
jgi:hypothetical protein